MEVARAIIEKHLSHLQTSTPNLQKPITYTKKNLSSIIVRLGDLECQKEEFPNALKLFQQVLELRKQTENVKTSRNLAEVYFLIGNTYLYQAKSEAEENALENYYKAKEILENNLRMFLNVDVL